MRKGKTETLTVHLRQKSQPRNFYNQVIKMLLPCRLLVSEVMKKNTAIFMSKKDFHHEHLRDTLKQSYVDPIYRIEITTVKKTKASDV